MTQTVTIALPEETVRRYQRSAAAAHKPLEEFLAERLLEVVPPLAEDLPPTLSAEFEMLEHLDDEALWQVARSHLPSDRQHLYDTLLDKNSQGSIRPDEKELLTALGEEARVLTLKKAHAYMLLKWRGHTVPMPDGSQQME